VILGSCARSRECSCILMLLVFVSILGCAPDESTSVDVINRTGGAISDVHWEYSGGSHTVGRIEDGASYEWAAQPSAPSSLVMTYVESDGSRQRVDMNVYMEPSLGTTVRLTVLPGARIIKGSEKPRPP